MHACPHASTAMSSRPVNRRSQIDICILATCYKLIVNTRAADVHVKYQLTATCIVWCDNHSIASCTVVFWSCCCCWYCAWEQWSVNHVHLTREGIEKFNSLWCALYYYTERSSDMSKGSLTVLANLCKTMIYIYKYYRNGQWIVYCEQFLEVDTTVVSVIFRIFLILKW